MKQNITPIDSSISFLRITLGILFILPGIEKILYMDMTITMLGLLGFPFSSQLAWLLALSEIILGFLLLIGYKLRLIIWPLMAILLVATTTLIFPAMGKTRALSELIFDINLLLHFVGIAALFLIYLSDPRKSLSKD